MIEAVIPPERDLVGVDLPEPTRVVPTKYYFDSFLRTKTVFGIARNHRDKPQMVRVLINGNGDQKSAWTSWHRKFWRLP